MSWLALAAAVSTALLVLMGPGILIACAGGARRFYLWAIAPGISVGTLAALGIVYPQFGVRWSPATAGLGILIIATLVWVCARVLRSRSGSGTVERVRITDTSARRPVFGRRFTLLACMIPAVVITAQILFVFSVPEAVSQTFDAAFHLNGIRYLDDIGSASSFELTGFILAPGTSSFYPAAWHAIAATVFQLSGVSIPIVANAVNLVIAAVVWPAGLLLLVRMLLPQSRAAFLAAGVLAAAFPGFPLLPLDYGVLYPYFLALALVPSALAIGLSVLGLVGQHGRSTVAESLVLVFMLVGIGLAQPSAALGWAAFMLAPLVAAYLRLRKMRPSRRWRLVAVVLLGIALTGFVVVWLIAGRVGYSSPWWAYASPAQGLLELFGLTLNGLFPAVFAGLFMTIGVVALLRRSSQWWLAVSWMVGAALFFLAASMPFWTLRNVILGPFYKDGPRLFALLAVISVPVAAWGAHAMWEWWAARRKGTAGETVRTGTKSIAAATVAVVLLLAGTQSFGMASALSNATTSYALTATSPILSINERALIERLDVDTNTNGLIVGNPWTGTAFAYALSGRNLLNPHFNSAVAPEAAVINTRLNQALEDPTVCDAVNAVHARYVLDFGSYTKDNGDLLEIDSSIGYEGLLDLVDNGIVKEIDREGESAILYEITACD